MPVRTTHPKPEELSAYSLGQLPPDEAAVVESHISDCQSCCETMLGLSSEDTFVGLLQEAKQLPVDQTLDQDGLPAKTSSSSHDIPAPLAEHPRYEIVGLIGKGGMGDVYRARHRMMDRTVAVKIINCELVRRPEAVDRFHREVKTAAQLSHPNIVTSHDAEQAGDVHYLVMEYVDGTDLSHLAKDQGALPVAEACDYVRQAAIGLQHAHQQGMVHRDIKPHNLMVTADGTVKILDFGLASLAPEALPDADTVEARSDLTAAGAIMGTPDFISPEQADDARQADIRSDIYSLGATLYFLLSGRPPFTDGSVMHKLKSHAQVEPDKLESLRDDIPADLAAVVTKMMAKDADERFQTPAEVAEALATFVITTTVGPQPAQGGPLSGLSGASEPPPSGPRSAMQSPLARLLWLLLIVITFGIGWYSWTTYGDDGIVGVLLGLYVLCYLLFAVPRHDPGQLSPALQLVQRYRVLLILGTLACIVGAALDMSFSPRREDLPQWPLGAPQPVTEKSDAEQFGVTAHIILDQGYTILDNGKSIGSRRLVVTEEAQTLSIVEEYSLALKWEGAPLGIVERDVSADYSLAGEEPLIIRGATSTKEQGSLVMHGTVEFNSGEALTNWTSYTERGRKLETPRKQQATVKRPSGPLVLGSTIQVVAPLLLPEDGERKIVWGNFDDHTPAGKSLIEYDAGCTLRRTSRPKGAGFTITLFKPGSDEPEMTLEYDTKGNCETIRTGGPTVIKRLPWTVAFQDVGNALRKIQSAKFVMAIKSPGEPEQKVRVYVQIPGRMREEMPDGVTRIVDLGEGRFLELHATQKTADLIEIPKVSKQKQPPNIIEILRGLLRRAEAGEEGLVVKKLGEKTIEGRETIGFQVNSDDEKGEYLSYTIWGDAKTALPVRVEQRMKTLDTTIVMTDFVYNLKLAPDLFSLATPAGYETKNTKVDLDLSLPGEKDLVTALRLYAENTDGTLPQAMDKATINKLMDAFLSITRAPEGVDPNAAKKMIPIAITMGRAQAFILSLKPDGDAHFAKAPVKLGEADRPVFWFKPAGKNHFRVIYGDLQVKDVKQAPVVNTQ